MPKKDVTLGIDIGGTNTVLGFVDREGNCLAEIISILHQCARKTPHLRNAAGRQDQGTPCAAPGELRSWASVWAPQCQLLPGHRRKPAQSELERGNSLVELMKEHFDLPVVITNDANAAALGEMLFGAAKGMRDFIVITLGTGLGSGLVSNGELIYGADGFAGEIGHTIVEPQGASAAAGNAGAWKLMPRRRASAAPCRRLLCLSRRERTAGCQLPAAHRPRW